MGRTTVRSEQIRDANLQVVDLKDFAVVAGTGLNIVIEPGRIRNNNVVYETAITNTSVANNVTSYIEVSNIGVVSINNSGFTAGKIPLAIVVAASGVISSVTDKRTWLPALTVGPTGPQGSAGAAGATGATGPQGPTGPIYAAQAINGQSGTTYTLVLADAGKVVTLNNASAIAVTIPTNGSVNFPVGTKIDFLQIGAGKVTFSGAGVTINSLNSLKSIAARYVAVTLFQTATDVWCLIGNLVA